MAVSAVVADWSGARYLEGNDESLEEYMTQSRVEGNMNTDEYTLTAFVLNTENGVTVEYRGEAYLFTVSITSSGNSAKVIYEGSSDGTEVTLPTEEGENFADAVTATNYGDYVDYPIDLNEDGDTTNDWRIFYDNGTNIFLIAEDYVKSDSEYLDLSAAQMYRVADNPAYSSYIYSLNWYDSVNSTTTLTSSQGNADINSTMSSLFIYGKYLTQNPTSTNINAQATAAMLAQPAWNGFKDSNGYAEYVVGGPTLEMWIASYNAKGYDALYTNVNDTGYYVGNEEGTTIYGYNVSSDTNTGYSDTLYFRHQESVSNCGSYWLTSPSGINSNSIMFVYYDGFVQNNGYNSYRTGVRPLVSLYSNVTATQGEDDVWILSN